MGKKNIFILLLLASLFFLLPGCVKFKSEGEGQGEAGGVHISTDRGDSWQQRNLIPTTQGKPKSISGIAVNELVMDPSDPNAFYMASQGVGMFYTFDISEGWQKAKGLPNAKIDAVAVNPQSKCIIYASAGNKLYKSTDCNRTWEPVYHDNSKKANIHGIVIDHYNPKRIFIGTSRGIILKSEDGGGSWSKIKDAGNTITELHISPHDSRIIFATTKNKGTFRTKDGGDNWINLEKKMKDFPNSKKVRDLDIHESQEGLMFMATNYGLLKSDDYGDNWSKIELLTPEKKATINAVAVNPKDSAEMYYVTQNTFYRSLDGGNSWSTKALPTQRVGVDLLINPKKPNIIYLGAGKKPGQGGGGPFL